MTNVTFTLECLPEDIDVRDVHDKECEDEIVAALERGNEWAWCTVCVTAEWRGLTGSAFLGGCSYESEAQFRSNSGEYENMKQEALRELEEQAEAVCANRAELAVR